MNRVSLSLDCRSTSATWSVHPRCAVWSRSASRRTESLAHAVNIVLLLLMTLIGYDAQAGQEEPRPSAALSPQQVVKVVIDALQHNDPKNDQGIATVFRFASPANKMNTGPLDRFRLMIHRGFPDMLNHSAARYEVMQIEGDIAWQTVWLRAPSGRENGYGFKLRKQHGGDLEGAWMTDAVVPLGQSSTSGLRI